MAVAALHAASGVLAVGGKEHELTLWDAATGKETFVARNVGNTMLDLRVPVWVAGIQFLGGGTEPSTAAPHLLAVATGHRQVRLYDARANRRPVKSVDIGDHPFTVSALAPDGASLLVGDTAGTLIRLDLATLRQIGAYQGIGGSIRSISVWSGTSQPLVATAGLDRCVRVHHIETRALLRRIYLKQRLTAVAFAPETTTAPADEEGEDGGYAVGGSSGGLTAEVDNSGRIRLSTAAAAEAAKLAAAEAGEDDGEDDGDVWAELDRRAKAPAGGAAAAAAAPATATVGTKRGRPAAAASSAPASRSKPAPRGAAAAAAAVAGAAGDLGSGEDSDFGEGDFGDLGSEGDDGEDEDDGFSDEDDDEEDGGDDDSGGASEDDALVDSKSAAKSLLKQVETLRRGADKDRRRAAAAAPQAVAARGGRGGGRGGGAGRKAR